VPEARVVAVNVVYEVRDLVARGPTAIDKRPVAGPVLADRLGFAGDRQCGRGHGGPDKALYAYASEDAAWWAGELALEVHPGLFGENLTTAGLDVCGAHIGEVWQIGGTGAGPVVEVRMPRTPCDNLSARMELPGFHARFAASGRVGALLRVRSPGAVSAGDPVAVVHRPEHGSRSPNGPRTGPRTARGACSTPAWPSPARCAGPRPVSPPAGPGTALNGNAGAACRNRTDDLCFTRAPL
jgi:MOSC domain-containing protein YiiM